MYIHEDISRRLEVTGHLGISQERYCLELLIIQMCCFVSLQSNHVNMEWLSIQLPLYCIPYLLEPLATFFTLEFLLLHPHIR